MVLETPRLKLIPCDSAILEKAIESDEALARHLNVKVANSWTEFGTEALQYALEKLKTSSEAIGWWTYFPIHKEDNTLIGSGGYNGPPSADGTVELGYEIAPAYRNKGLGTEMTRALISNVFKNPGVNRLIAYTLKQEEDPSAKILENCGFQRTEIINDPDEGELWKWVFRSI